MTHRYPTPEQNDAIELLGRNGQAVHVRLPYADGSIEATQHRGDTVLIATTGKTTKRPHDNTIDWEA